jgi:3-oxoisoapionate kinase
MKRLVSFYGDDFTGSTDVMEALSTHGIETVLFTRLPTPDEFAPFATCQAIGLAGTSRSQTPDWMDKNLPPIFAWLKTLEAQFCHYKVCSTFDSSRDIGNIGRASEIGAATFGQSIIPLVVGAPQLKRYTFAGHLFAGYQGETYRIDSHPVMSKHPVTPMQESDLRLHLAQQTQMSVTLANSQWPTRGMALIDVYDAVTQLQVGQRLQEAPQDTLPFVVGSSGVEYALVKSLTSANKISGKANFAPLDKVENCIVVSGSVSPTTARQIQTAQRNGFEAISLSPIAMARDEGQLAHETVAKCLEILEAGKSPLVHTALGSASDETAALNSVSEGRLRIGLGLGSILRAVLEKTNIKRAIIAGGDSSSHALGQLDIYALQTRFPLTATPGSPLCTATSSNAKLNGLEIAMKGGQVGSDEYFMQLRDGLTQ